MNRQNITLEEYLRLRGDIKKALGFIYFSVSYGKSTFQIGDFQTPYKKYVKFK